MLDTKKDCLFLPLVTVITPVYNGEKYLSQCIESVLAQTYPNWEYIIVNNCSTDHSLEIAQRYARQDARIRIYTNQKFVSVIQNHNIALQYISPASKYCKIVHADDWLFPECLTRMVEVAEAHPSVGIVSAYRLDEVQVNLDGLPYPSTVVPGREICRSTLLGGPYVFGSPTSLLIRSDCIRNRAAFYDEANFSFQADTAACYEVLQEMDFGFVHQVLTYTRRPSESVISHVRRMNTYVVAILMMLKKYGPVYLTPEEYKRCLRRTRIGYYRFLGRSVFHLRDKQFWDYHRNALRNFGESFIGVKLTAAALFEAFITVLSPVEILKKSIRKKEIPPSVRSS